MTDDQQRQDAEQRPNEDVDFPSEADENSHSETDWGLKKPKSGMGKEVKIVATVVLLVCGFFGYVLYSKTTAPVEENDSTEISGSNEPEPPKKQEPIKQVSSNAPQAPQSDDVIQPLDINQSEPASTAALGAHETNYGAQPTQNPRARYEQQFQETVADADPPAEAAVPNDLFGEQDDWQDNSTVQNNQYNDRGYGNDGNELPVQQNNEYPQDDTAGLTSLDANESVNPFEPTSNAEPDDIATTAEPVQNGFDFPEEEYAPHDIAGQSTIDDRNFGDGEIHPLDEANIVADERYAPPVESEYADTQELAEPLTELSDSQFHDPRTGPYQGIKPHSGQASSTTIVRRSEEPEVETETAFTDPAQAADRFSGYRSVGEYKKGPQREPASDDLQTGADQWKKMPVKSLAANTLKNSNLQKPCGATHSQTIIRTTALNSVKPRLIHNPVTNSPEIERASMPIPML